MDFQSLPKGILRLLKYPPRLAYAIGLGPLYGRIVLLLTTTGRKSGLKRITPLQYEEIDGELYIGSARGVKADWFRNIQANPQVELRVKSHQFQGIAEPVTNPERIADFLEVRLQRHPRMVGGMLRAEGLPPNPSHAQLAAHAENMAMVKITPVMISSDPIEVD
jgi:deazaflavin-dependent oxidoreductase (nitroreductase family)